MRMTDEEIITYWPVLCGNETEYDAFWVSRSIIAITISYINFSGFIMSNLLVTELATDCQHQQPRSDVMFPKHSSGLGSMCSALANGTSVCSLCGQETCLSLVDFLQQTQRIQTGCQSFCINLKCQTRIAHARTVFNNIVIYIQTRLEMLHWQCLL